MFLKLFKKENFNPGWAGGEEENKDKRNYLSEEIFKNYPTPKWETLPINQWRRFEPIRNQDGSSACVAFSIALACGIENYLEEKKFEVLSARYIYSRGFLPDGGMVYRDALNIAVKEGIPLEAQMPSDGKREEEMRKRDDETKNIRQTAQIYKPQAYIFLPLDIHVIAGIIQATGKGILLGTRFNRGGFSKPEVVLDKNGEFGHAVVATTATLYNNKPSLIFQNSWIRNNWGINGLGIITEDQFNRGVLVAIQLIDFVYEKEMKPKPKLKIESSGLKIEDKGSEVIKLQIMLQYLGYFPANQECTGYYGGLTRQAVKNFQKDNNLEETGIADIKTINKLNEIFRS